MDVRQYLSRIRYHGDSSPTLDNLRAIYQAHMLTVPFENLSILCGEEIVLDLQLLYNKIVVKRRGGFCYECNGLFAWLLGQLGFKLKTVSAQVWTAEKEEFTSELSHVINVVSIDGESWVTDVGYGCVFRTPIRLVADQEHPDITGTYRLQQEGDTWFLQRKSKARLDADNYEAVPGGIQKDDMAESGEWTVMYKFTLQEHELQDFSEMCTWTQRFSSFTERPLCVLHLADGVVTYTGRKLITTRYYNTHLTKTTTVLDSDNDILKVLWDTFGIRLENPLVIKE
ncbi:PREDICTED: arylamine N-acetyltransferase, pineal gland isozyme NAT-10-like [Branchiostoma belcheri]|uniref:arylamine N-acetyltransferase n=1 Tax=Branchiostoma belcheri TaxID=7741 RepID=A0A6P4YE47_BRABE|nr:PREDICTED: arylamine N-acetyltransferase, pineal gland isozyme NAT-10-like [Branchiostoma belcheri]